MSWRKDTETKVSFQMMDVLDEMWTLRYRHSKTVDFKILE